MNWFLCWFFICNFHVSTKPWLALVEICFFLTPVASQWLPSKCNYYLLPKQNFFVMFAYYI